MPPHWRRSCASAKRSRQRVPPSLLQVNAVTHLGQPALLYLCPLTLGAVGVTAARRGDLALIWNYADTTASPAPAKGKAEQQGGDAQ